MAFDLFQGDPRLVLTPDGVDLEYQGGQPVMDQGVENHVLISLFTRAEAPDTGEPWCGNAFQPSASKLGSDFEARASQPITLAGLALVERAAASALSSPLFGAATVAVTNPVADYLDVRIQAGAGAMNVRGNRDAWTVQALFPAAARLS